MLKYLFLFSSTTIFSLLAMFILRKYAQKANCFISKEIALIGGAGICCAWLFSLFLGVLVFGIDHGKILPFVGVSLVMLLLGVIDDLKEASVLQKIAGQSVCAVLLISLDIRTHIIYFDYVGNCVISYFWILGITNALNLLDTMDGLSSGVAFIVTAALFILSSFYPAVNIQILTAGLSAAVLGAFIFNFPPATIYLGNAGSHFLGFLLAALTLMVSYTALESPIALVSPVIILWIPLFETVCLIYFRLRKKISPFNKSNDHIVFRLVALGLTQKIALFVMLGSACFYAVCGIIISRVSNISGIMIVIVVLLTSVGFFQLLTKAGRHGE